MYTPKLSQITTSRTPANLLFYALYACITCMYYMYYMYHIYVSYLCIISMYHIYVLHVCITCMEILMTKNQQKTKKMRLDALIIFLIEWTQMELILRGKQWKY